jgi:cysteine-S-conjugate beta-lyase
MSSRPCLKWNYYDPDVLCAWVAEMDFGLAPAVAEALHEAVHFGDTGYPYPGLEEAAARAATDFWRARFGWDVEPNRVFPAPDVIEAGRRAISLLTRPGSSVVLHTPVYFPFFSMIGRAGRDVLQVPSTVDEEGIYRIDIDGIDEALRSGAGSVVLCNPWNPVGRSLERGEVSEVLELAKARGARVISDEIHAPLLFDGRRHMPAASVDPETVITITSSSKAFNTPGLKCAQVVLTNDDDLTRWQRYFTPEKVGVGTFGLIAAAAAYDGGQSWLDEVIGRLQDNRDEMLRFAAERMPRVRVHRPEATFLAWFDFGDYGWTDPAQVLLEDARVALSSGPPFGIGGEGHARLNFATDRETLLEILERMTRVL